MLYILIYYVRILLEVDNKEVATLLVFRIFGEEILNLILKAMISEVRST